MKTLYNGQALAAPKKKSALVEASLDAEDEDEEPLLMDPSITDLRAALGAADVWLYVLDARDPLAHRTSFVEKLATEMGKKVVFVLNKIGVPHSLLSPVSRLTSAFTTRHCPEGVGRLLALLPPTTFPHLPLPRVICPTPTSRRRRQGQIEAERDRRSRL